ncbi:hypothetical protein RD055328_11290 [Companilactobacillus sp. RD055328]|uniref:WxL domain-containing protein n=1 Tax=Companilactobacillus sp. RD055328 TaxID=2916634 RepID=UPI001FC7D52C|nr:WxL domain-containing protein [Companilactobacillus sp. RD055328]GKQ43206.1 hypothetical protein RD055328_11290 [Companilactobacillus sp. RD055328]
MTNSLNIKKIVIITAFLSALLMGGSSILAADNKATNTNISFNNQTENSLEIVNVPSLNFGTHTSGDKTLAKDTSDKPHIHIKDSTGTYNGWDLTVKTEGFYNQDKLNKNFRLFFNKPSIVPTENNAAIDAPVFSSEQVEVGTTPTQILKASENKGIGHWLANFYDDNMFKSEGIQLQIPTSAYQGHYQANLVWELNAGPSK